MKLTPEAQTVYRAMLTEPALGVAGLAGRLNLEEAAVRAALDVLADEALLRDDPSQPGTVSVAHPRLALARVIARAEADLAERQHHVNAMREMLETIAIEYENEQHAERIVVHTRGSDIQARLEELSLGARTECVSLNPGRAHRPHDMAASKPLNQVALERGVGIRAIYQDSFRLDQGTLEYARWLTDLGGEVRTLPVVPQLMVLVDREVALLPRTPDQPSDGAVEVWAPGLVAPLVDYFEAMWAMADPFGTPAPREGEAELPALTRQVLAMLARGVTDESAAHKLGVSARTVRRLVATVMTELGAQSRFQVGVEAVRRGWIDGTVSPRGPGGTAA